MRYVLYRIDNGEIVKQIDCPPDFIEMQADDNHSYLECSIDASWITHKVVDGAVVQLENERTKPSNSHVWDFEKAEWVDLSTLSSHKDAKWEAIKAARNAAEKSTFVWNGHIVDADMARLNGAATSVMIAQAQGYGYSDTWTLADNSTLPVSGADILEMGLALAAHVSACHARGRALRQQILACTTKEQVDAIEWSLP